MPNLPILKTQKFVKILKKLGFFLHHQTGSHAQFKHLDGRRTTISIHPGKDIPTGTLRAILRDIKISPQELTEKI